MTIADHKINGYFTVNSNYRNAIPETHDITWDDVFFENNDIDAADVVAVFDFDYNRMIRFWTQKEITRQAFLMIVVTFLFSSQYAKDDLVLSLLPLLLYILSGAPFFLSAQVRWKAFSMHCAVTRDGIMVVRSPYKTFWGLSVCTRKKQRKTVRFEEIKDCEIFEPIGNVYFWIPEALTTVIVDKSTKGGRIVPVLRLPGLKDPYTFKKLVWAMIRAKENGDLFDYKAPTTIESELTEEEEMPPVDLV